MSTIDPTVGGAEKLLNGLGWMMVFAYINLLWIAFTFMGLIIFGISPVPQRFMRLFENGFKEIVT
ncbi:DUF624 domain-containing protein [Shouchella patagoniensis]|uniref:DUF624 domain-containing protein n=1 Tax=Shouchella patagoniensis TaxID=228576 RepID=UPI001FE90B08|nr:DUF624 domain-containing protein [Shouchella patagoniensis]